MKISEITQPMRLSEANAGSMPNAGSKTINTNQVNRIIKNHEGQPIEQIANAIIDAMDIKQISSAHWDGAGRRANKNEPEIEARTRKTNVKKALHPLLSTGEALNDEQVEKLNQIATSDFRATKVGHNTGTNVAKASSDRAEKTFGMIPDPVETAPQQVMHGRSQPFEIIIVEKDGNKVVYETGITNTNTGETIKLRGGLPMRVKNLPDAIEADKKYNNGEFFGEKVRNPMQMTDDQFIGLRFGTSAITLWPTEPNENVGYIILGSNKWTEHAKKQVTLYKAQQKSGDINPSAKDKKSVELGSGTSTALLVDDKGLPYVNPRKQTLATTQNLIRVGTGNDRSAQLRSTRDDREAQHSGAQQSTVKNAPNVHRKKSK